MEKWGWMMDSGSGWDGGVVYAQERKEEGKKGGVWSCAALILRLCELMRLHGYTWTQVDRMIPDGGCWGRHVQSNGGWDGRNMH